MTKKTSTTKAPAAKSPPAPEAPAQLTDAEREARAEQLAAENQALKDSQQTSTQPATGQAPTQEPSEAAATASDNEAEALKPVVGEQGEWSEEVRERVAQSTGGTGFTPEPTMVNGKYVGDKKYNEATGEWENDPDKAPTGRRPSDIFDRIGDAFQHESQRLVIEEIARAAGMGDDSTDLPKGMPASKSTASLRQDVSGYGGFAAGDSLGATPVAPGPDGKAQEE